MLEQPYQSAVPRWTVPSFPSIAGRFPLGLEAVALSILANNLAPGLPVLSRHPRYWSIYTYLIKRFQDTRTYTNKTNNIQLGRYLKSREIIFGCAALLCPLHQQERLRNVIGSDTFTAWLDKTKSSRLPLPISATGELGSYLQQSLGGYGQVYRGAMIDLELIFPPESNPKGEFDIVYGDLGIAVAETFANAIRGTRYVQEYIDKDDITVPREVVEELATVSCFCQLRNHEPERKLLTEILLGQAQATASTHASNSEIVQKRRQRADTVRLFLDLAKQVDEPLYEWTFRELLYKGSYGNSSIWQPRQAVQKNWRQWWLIQLREFIVSALNNLLKDFVQWGSKDGVYHSLSVDSYINEVCKQPLPTLLGFPNVSLAQISLGQLSQIFDGWVSQNPWPLSESAPGTIDRARSEYALQPVTPCTAFLILLLVQRRLASIHQQNTLSQEEINLLQEGGRDRLSTAYLDRWFAELIIRDEPAYLAFSTLIKDMVIEQHLNVALEKLPISTFRFYEEDNGIRFHPDKNIETSAISVRFDAISEALYGLDLIKAPLNKSNHGPSKFGKEILHA